MMPETDSFNSNEVFVGRKSELKALKKTWLRTTQGDPLIVVVRGEPGSGKTRLVQEFYRWLSTHNDSDDYWPDTLGKHNKNLEVNPDFLKDRLPCVEIPWLWCGVRFMSPSVEPLNFGSDLIQIKTLLRPHILPSIVKERRKNITIEIIEKLGISIIGLWTFGLPDAIKNFSELLTFYNEEKSLQKFTKLNIAEQYSKFRHDALEEVISFFRNILISDEEVIRNVPVVIFIDDAQWVSPEILSLIDTLFIDAVKNNWKLLVICTHWHREWKLKETEDSSDSSEPPQSITDLLKRNNSLFHQHCKFLDLPKMEDEAMHRIIQPSLPGLKNIQRKQLISRVDGNPSFLEDLIDELKLNSQYFVDNNFKKKLTASGEEQLNLLPVEHLELIKKRFKKLNENMRNLLARSSYQGVRFLKPLTLQIESMVDNSQLQSEKLLMEAEDPFMIVLPSGKNSIEFRHRGMYEVAFNRYKEEFTKLDKEKFQLNMRNKLESWLRNKDLAGTLEPDEWHMALNLLIDVIDRPESSEDSELLLLTHFKLVESYYVTGLFNLAVKHVKYAIQLIDSGTMIPIAIEINTLLLAGNLLFQSREFKACRKLFIKLKEIVEQNTETNNEMVLNVIYLNLALTEKHLDNYEDALNYEESTIKSLNKYSKKTKNELPIEHKFQLATAYLNKSNTLTKLAKDYKDWFLLQGYQYCAIELLENLIGELDPRDYRQLLIKDRLANAYSNHGISHKIIYDIEGYKREKGHSCLARALEDDNRAINIRETLRRQFKKTGKLHMELRENRAKAYLNRANTHKLLKNSESALMDATRSLIIRKILRKQLEYKHSWLSQYQTNLARAYDVRAAMLFDLNCYSKSIEDITISIQILEYMREQSESTVKWSNEQRDELATYYLNRHVFYYKTNNYSKALSDLDHCIDILETMKEELNPKRWLSIYQGHLETAYRYHNDTQQRINT